MRILFAAALIAAAPLAAQAQTPQAHEHPPAAAPNAAPTTAPNAAGAEDQSKPEGHHPAAAPGGRMGMGSMGMEIDEDGLTRDEFMARHARMFARMDADGDGRLTREEFAAHRAMMHGPGEPSSSDGDHAGH